MYIFEEVKRRNLGVAAFQVIQQDCDVLRIKIRAEPGYGKATEDLIRKRVQSSYGKDTRVAFELVDEIRREPSGKMRLVVGMR